MRCPRSGTTAPNRAGENSEGRGRRHQPTPARISIGSGSLLGSLVEFGEPRIPRLGRFRFAERECDAVRRGDARHLLAGLLRLLDQRADARLAPPVRFLLLVTDHRRTSKPHELAATSEWPSRRTRTVAS